MIAVEVVVVRAIFRSLSMIGVMLALATCGRLPAALEQPNVETSPVPVQQTPSAQSYTQAQFLDDLRVAGATVEAPSMEVDYGFMVKGHRIEINDEPLIVFEFADLADAQANTAIVSPDGYTFSRRDASGQIVEVSEVEWDDPPHFYQRGNLIVVYSGTDATMLDLLAKHLGSQFAGS